MKTAKVVAVTLTLAAVGASSAVHAWAPIASSRPVWRSATPYELNMSGSRDLGGFAATEVEVRRGFEDWTRVSCTDLELTYRGATSRTPTVEDRNSTVGWIESGWRFDANAIGVTQPQFGASIVEADMSMNAVNFTWITGPGSGDDVNTYSIVLHEAGHYLGLDHSSDRTAAMYFAYSGGTAVLGDDDELGICSLYPGPGRDCSMTGCPSGYDCTAGACVERMGSGGACATCASGADCANGICLTYPDGAFCGANCTTNADCAAGSQCRPVSGGAPNQCVRYVGLSPSCTATPGCRTDANCGPTERCNVTTAACEPRPSGGILGARCSSSTECSSGICFAGRCSESCDWLDPAGCPGGFYCNGQATGTCNAGLCLAGIEGGGQQGDPCGDNTDCATLLCDRGICTTPCIPGGLAECAAGYGCQEGISSGCGSCQQAGALGDACVLSDDCLSGTCAASGSGSFCTDYCDASSPCPAGFACVPVDATTSVCAPNRGGLGAPCTEDAACAGVCAGTGSDRYCTRSCSDSEPCPREYACAESATGNVCLRRQGRSSGGCAVSVSNRAMPLGFLLALLGFIATRRRRNG